MSLIDILGNFLYNMVFALIYPFMYIINIFIELIEIIYNAFINLYLALTGLFDNLYNSLVNISNLFPLTWFSLILMGFIIVFGLRLYHFIKDISIAGFKI